MLYDVFICHASEDKATFVRPLADALQSEHVAVWYDEFTLKVGDSIRRTIDKGLKQSRFAIVVISPEFFAKRWPHYELDGLVEREMRGADKVILPIWHSVTHDDVMEYSPSLAGRKAINSSQGIQAAVDELLEVIRPQASPLVIARDTLLEWGMTPPVITDEYWLDIAAASNKAPGFGAMVPAESIWDLWSFPLPYRGNTPAEFGRRLAWTAMQSGWVKDAEAQRMTLITNPEKLLEFIYSHVGMTETCSTYPRLLAEYAPQLTIRGMGGLLEPYIEDEYRKSCISRAQAKLERGGSGLTTTGEGPLCSDEWALRHPTFGNYDAAHIACEYFSGGMFGPSVSPYHHADHLFWLLSNDSKWLPSRIRRFMLKGMRDWAVWHWGDYAHGDHEGDWETRGQFGEELFDASEQERDFCWSPSVVDDLKRRIEKGIDDMSLLDSAANIYRAFRRAKMPESFANSRLQVRRRQSMKPAE